MGLGFIREKRGKANIGTEKRLLNSKRVQGTVVPTLEETKETEETEEGLLGGVDGSPSDLGHRRARQAMMHGLRSLPHIHIPHMPDQLLLADIQRMLQKCALYVTFVWYERFVP